MDTRELFFRKLIQSSSSRILELGPLNNPIAKKQEFPNTYYADIRSTDEVRELYTGNDYLKATGIQVDLESIVPIDYVVEDTYTKTFQGVERFDYVIASHVLEHMPNLLYSFQDIGNILKEHGVFCIIYPDKRYSFDHFRLSSSFRDVYHVFRQGNRSNAPMVLDFYFSSIKENDPIVFWNQEDLTEYLPNESIADANDKYLKSLQGDTLDDVHYWPFSDLDFLQFLYDATRAGLFPYRCIAFEPCKPNTQQFMIALEYDPTVLTDHTMALNVIVEMIHQFNSKELHKQKLISEDKDLQALLLQKQKQEKKHIAFIDDLEKAISKKIEEQEINAAFICSLEEALKGKDQEQKTNIDYIHSLEEALKGKDQEQKTNIEYIHSLEETLKSKDQEQKTNIEYIHSLEGITVEKQKTIDDLESSVHVYKAELETARILADHHRVRIAELEEIEQSWAWKMTKPLRNMVEFFKRLSERKANERTK